jgi:hypothetical protein
MTRRELISTIKELLQEFSDQELEELADYGSFLAWRREMESLKRQYKESLKEIEAGELHSLQELEKKVDMI